MLNKVKIDCWYYIARQVRSSLNYSLCPICSEHSHNMMLSFYYDNNYSAIFFHYEKLSPLKFYMGLQNVILRWHPTNRHHTFACAVVKSVWYSTLFPSWWMAGIIVLRLGHQRSYGALKIASMRAFPSYLCAFPSIKIWCMEDSCINWAVNLQCGSG